MNLFDALRTVTLAGDTVENSAWRTFDRWANARAASFAEYLMLGTWIWFTAEASPWAFVDWESPVAEGVGYITVGAWLCSNACSSAPDVFASLAATFQVLQVAARLETNFFPPAFDEAIHQNAARTPYCFTSETRRVTTSETST